MNLPLSVVETFFSSKPFADWKKWKESEMTALGAIHDREIDNGRATVGLSKSLAAVIRSLR